MEVVESTTEPTFELRREIAEVAAIAAGAAMQHGLGKDVTNIDELYLHRRDSIGQEVAEVAVKKGFVRPEDFSQLPLAAINEIAILAASTAIRRGTTEFEELPVERVEEARQLAMKAAEMAIQRKFVPDERNDPTLSDIAQISQYAAGAALQKGLASDTVEEEMTMKKKEVASLAAGSAIQHGYAMETPDEKTLHVLSDISKTAAQAALQKTASGRVQEIESSEREKKKDDLSENYLKAAREAAQFAIDHKLIDRPDPPFELVSEVARLAAGAAIQRGLSDEVTNKRTIDERKEFVAAIARHAASFAIQKGLGAEVVPNRRMAYELAVLAASAAIRNQIPAAAEHHEAQLMAQVARQAAQEAVRLGYGMNESEAMDIPKTPPVTDNAMKESPPTAPAPPPLEDTNNPKEMTEAATTTTDLVNKEQSEEKTMIYKESELQEVVQPSSCFCLFRCFRPSPST